MDGLEERQTRFELRTDTSLNLINDKLDILMDSRNQVRGSWKTVIAVCAVVAFLAGLATWAVSEKREAKADSSQTGERVEQLIQLIENRETKNAEK
jgi:hypothetical protein